MGLLINGVWRDQWYDTATTGGKFVRQDAAFRNWVTPDGTAGPTGGGGFKAEAGRYHLYVSLACPWASRTLIYRKLKGLEDMVSLSVTHWHMGEDGWSFAPDEGVIPDTVNGAYFMRDIYRLAKPAYTGRVTVPVLWDKHRRTIVSNEFLRHHPHVQFRLRRGRSGTGRLLSGALRAEIDAINARVYPGLNNGVYRAGFATTQEAYDAALADVFATLDWLEDRLGRSRFLLGGEPLECDWRLFTTLVRFDPVYVGHFKCNIRRLTDYPNLWAYTRDLYQWPGIRETVDFRHIKGHYYTSHPAINPTRIVPGGPALDFDAPHGRANLKA